ncbi:hypothetical protein [Arthrobacter sp. AL12]|uniref:DUF6993 domain-containing protein n=1 Tax=Arthrobacter sp. AL12 TaxID=3042241 RepID=UPI00249BE387|nr:hypothetical protein [Arthrobacter sp. AL12]MDI3213853.1 hypothetical protein [Arthrobacter sp. AL12]
MTSSAPAPVRSTRGRRHVGLVALVLPFVIGMAACSAPEPTVTPGSVWPPGSAGSTTAPAGQPTAAASPSGAAPSAVSQSVSAALQALVASSPQPSTAQVRESLAAAGFAPAAVEVSAARTPTGLAADAVEVGVLGGNECVMAQLRSGTVATSVLPVLPNGRCFIGTVQR